MKLRQLLSGVASGYLTKGVQFLAAVSVVPFLLRHSVLGLEGYGSAFTLLAFSNFIGLIPDGPRNSFTRSVSQAIGDHPDAAGCTPGAALHAGTRILFWICTVVVALLLLSQPVAITLLGLSESADTRLAYQLAIGIFWAENVPSLLRVPLLARGAVSVVNYCATFEIIIRSVTFFLYFHWLPASIASYTAITLGFVVARNLSFAIYLYWRWPSDLRQRGPAPSSLVRGSLHYAGPIGLTSVITTTINRLPILVAHRFLGASDSGLIAVVVNTVRNYVIQLLFSVVEPMAVPISSRLNLTGISSGTRDIFWELEALYVFTIGLVIAAAIAALPQLTMLWLGPQYLSIVRPAQVLLLGCGFEIAFSIRRSILVGQGHLGRLVRRVALAGLVGLCGILFSAAWLHSWVWMVVSVAVFPVLSEMFGTSMVFELSFRDSIARPHSGLRVGAFILGTGLVGGLMSIEAISLPRAALMVLLSTLVTLVFAHSLMVPIPQALRTLRKLRRSLDRDLFSGAAINLPPR